MDDNIVMVKALQRAVSNADKPAIGFTTTAEAFAYLHADHAEPIELFIIDYHLREMSGPVFITEVKRIFPLLQDVPVFILSSDNKIDEREFADLNIVEYVLKPFSIKGLAEKIAAALV
ncbi:MAG: response regulator [Zetaproteobacteria bacterium]|nr:response regulator [Zetaproteobacteria bacterium]